MQIKKFALLLALLTTPAFAEHVQTCDQLMNECIDLQNEWVEAMLEPGSFKNGSYIKAVLDVKEEADFCQERLMNRDCWSTFSEN